ncbi:hypothetical protein B1H29_17495 [Streptomyces pactum]|uniref:Uncharacterized protein n=1 Tax=Streptomyces pactum TaxID=68249 RepID=A0A1S6JJV5_9ACTN|nr:hypothetical protein B1H29_17495 [Streptomyces pactum]
MPALFLLPFLIVLAGIVRSEPDDRSGGRKPVHVPCSEALAFGGAGLPDGARPVGECTMQGFQDIHYSASFRMPRTGVQIWPAHTYPAAPAPGTEFCAGADADLCLDLGYARGLPDGVDADAVQVRVEYEDAGTALVRFASFTL